jgi:hypothetical protein
MAEPLLIVLAALSLTTLARFLSDRRSSNAQWTKAR